MGAIHVSATVIFGAIHMSATVISREKGTICSKTQKFQCRISSFLARCVITIPPTIFAKIRQSRNKKYLKSGFCVSLMIFSFHIKFKPLQFTLSYRCRLSLLLKPRLPFLDLFSAPTSNL